MQVVNTYIFIPKQNKTSSKEDLYQIFNSFFHTKNDDNNSSSNFKNKNVFLTSYSIKNGKFQYKYNNKKIVVLYRIYCLDGIYYVDIEIDNTKINIIKTLIFINNSFLSNKVFNKNYTTILAYDYVSENYCNILFPELNKFERTFRKLLFLIFISNFKESYFEETASEELIKNVKGKIKRKKGIDKKEYQLQNYFYSADFGDLREFLFKKQWTIIEEKKLEEILKTDFSTTNEEDIKKMIGNLKPRSNWDRFFENKGFSDNIENTMLTINNLRNIVAHNKIIFEEDYLILKDSIKKLMIDIDKAIKITKTIDFLKIYHNKYKDLFSIVNETISKILKQSTMNVYMNTLNTYKNSFDTLLSTQKNIIDGLYTTIYKN